MFLIPLTVAFLLGIAIASRLDLPLFAWAWLLILPITYFLVWRRDAQIRRVVFLLFAFMLGALRFAFVHQPPDETALAHYNDRGRAVLTGQVVGPPDVRDRYANLRVSVSRIEINRVVSDTQGLALVQAPRTATARYGDSVRIEGTLTTPGESADFSYRDYLAREDIHSLVWATRVTVLATGQGNPFFASLYAFREQAHTTINAILPEPHAALLSGILLGDDNGMPSDLTDDFNATNTSHIIAISGFNVAIIAGLLARLAALIFPKRGVPGALLVILGIVTYTLFVGASASVVRAALMGSLTILAVQFNRQSLALNSLGASALFMLALNPLTLWDLGFQLSALATLGIILFADPLIAGFRKVMGRFSQNGWGQDVFRFLGDNLIVTLAAQITTTIIIAYTFHRLSLIGLLTNLLVLPVQPQVMIWGGLATLGGMLFLPLGQLLGWVAWIFLQWTILAVRVTGNLPFASIELGRFDGFVLAAYYLTIVVIWRWQDLKPFLAPDRLFGQVNVSRAGLVLLGGIALTLGSALPTLPDGRIHIEFLATEAGEATLVRTANGARILIDASDAPSQVLSALAERFPPWDRHLDVLVLTGNDEAHVNGASTVVERYAVDAIIEPDAPARRTPAYQQWNRLLDQKKLVSRRARAGLSFELDGVELEILYPVDSGDNVSLRLTAGNQNILFASALDKKDMPGFGLEAVDPAQVLVASPTLDPIVRARVNPSHVILFIGRRARDVPGDAFLAQLADATILRTDESGTIEMIISGEKVEVNTQR